MTAISTSDHISTTHQSNADIKINKVTNNAPSRWLSKGIEDFKTANLNSLLYGLFFVIAGAITIWYTQSNPLFIMAIVTGFYLVGPPVAAGLYDMSHRIEQDQPPSLLHAVSVLGKNTKNLLGMIVVLGLVMLAWTAVATLIVNAFFGDSTGISSGWNSLFMEELSVPFTGILLIGGVLLALLASAVSFTFVPLLTHKRMGTISVLVIMAFIMLAWVRMMILGINTFLNESNIIASGWEALLNNPQFFSFLSLFLVVGLVFAAFAFTISVVAVPMIIDKRVSALTAISTSIHAVKKNPAPMFRWAATIATLITIGMSLFFVGLAIALPIVGHASWHAYRELIADK